MTTDRELLEMAAKAARYQYAKHGGYIVVDGIPGNWNPLTDDGDALRLAVKLSVDVDHGERNDEQGTPLVIANYHYALKSGQVCWNSTSEEYGDDRCAATRRAIVRAAAAIGKAMK